MRLKSNIMKGIFPLFLLLTISTLSYSQCNPDPIYADSVFGIWPNPVENFVSGEIGVEYSQVIDFKVPDGKINTDLISEAIPIDSALIESIILDSVSNLPPGLSFSCDNTNCTWETGAGCSEIFGTPTTNGSYQITLDLTINAIIEIPFFGASEIAYPYSFDGYIINIGPVGINTYKVTNNTFKLDDAFPNPSNQNTTVQFVTGKRNNVSFQINNLLGETVFEHSVFSKVGVNEINLSTSMLKNGVYLYSISDGFNFSVKRLIVNH
jgi:hypothetical protein